MLAKIKALERKARVLEPNHKERKVVALAVERYAESFLEGISSAKTFTTDQINSEIYNLLAIKEDSLSLDQTLSLLKGNVIDPGMNILSPTFFGYVPGGSLYASAWGDYIAAITNRFPSIFSVSPGATRIENILVRWMAQLLGYSKNAGGNLTSGGSIANLIAIVTAREIFELKGKDYNKIVIYFSSQVHHSIYKALKIAGLHEAIIRVIPTDKRFRLDAKLLEKQLKEDKKKRLIPWLIVATLGTTNTGSIDPIAQIAEIAKAYQVWFHIDAAYGGFFILCQEIKRYFLKLKSADSITIDPHKGLFVPYGLGVVLTKEAAHLFKTHAYEKIDYLQDVMDDAQEWSPADVSPELSKHFRGLRLWLPLKIYGVAPFRAALNEKLLLARYFYEALLHFKNVEVACKPQLSIVTFRFKPEQGEANNFNKQLYEEIKKQGKVFFSTTLINNNIFLRMACLNFRTHLDAIELALDVLRQGIKKIIK